MRCRPRIELEYRASFVRDVGRIRNADVGRRVSRVIEDLESAASIADIPAATRIKSPAGRFYRIRIGDYRLGLALNADTCILVRCLHRRDIYRQFP